MKKSTKIWLWAAATLTITGAVLFASVMTALGWNFDKLSTVDIETVSYDITEDFDDLFIEASTADIEILPSKDGKCKVVCRELKNLKHSVSVEDRSLKILEEDERSWYEHIAITPFSAQAITLYLPEKDYGSLEIDLSTGDIRAESLSIENIDIKVSTGDTRLTDISCKTFTSDGSTGDILLKRVVADEDLNLKRSTGDIEFDGSDARSIKAKTSTGSIIGTLISGKTFNVDTSTGKIKVPENEKGGRCQLETSTGDIKIDIE